MTGSLSGSPGVQRVVTLGVDVGGTKIAAGLVDPATGEILDRRTVPSDPARGGERVLDDAVELARDLADTAGRAGLRLIGLGVGVAELVDPAGAIRSDDVLGWADLPVAARFAEIAPVRIEADVRAGALAEARFGAGRGARLVVYVTVGTGISSCLVIDGTPLAGARGNALVLASAPTTCRCPACQVTSSQVLEDIASGAGIARLYRHQTRDRIDGARDVVDAASRGAPIATAIIGRATTALGSAIGQLINVTDPDILVLGGGLGSAPGPFRDALVPVIRDHIWSPETRRLPIEQAAFGPDSGLIGAALVGATAIPDPPGSSPRATACLHPTDHPSTFAILAGSTQP